jgi:hypothetical protein
VEIRLGRKKCIHILGKGISFTVVTLKTGYGKNHRILGKLMEIAQNHIQWYVDLVICSIEPSGSFGRDVVELCFLNRYFCSPWFIAIEA